MNTELRAISDSQGRPLNLFSTAGEVSDDIGDRARLNRLPDVDGLIGYRGYGADWLAEALKDMVYAYASPVESSARQPSSTTSVGTNAETGTRLYSVGSKVGGVWQHDTIDAQRSQSQQSPTR